MPDKRGSDLEMILSTSMQSDVAMIKQILERDGIPYHFQGDSPQLFGILVVPMLYPSILRVPTQYVEAARTVLLEAGFLESPT